MLRILYGINGNGRGHMSRYEALAPVLRDMGHEVTSLISGDNWDRLDTDYKFEAFKFHFNPYGEVSKLKTMVMNDFVKFGIDVHQLNIFKYDMVISDFEPITAWAAKMKGKKEVVNFSHQAAFCYEECPRPNKKTIYEAFMAGFCPGKRRVPIHFQKYHDDFWTPLIKPAILDADPQEEDFYVVYLWHLPVHDLVSTFIQFKDEFFKIYTPNVTKPENIMNVELLPTSPEFVRDLINCKGVFCGAGFELASEALYLNKKLMVSPVPNQYEQTCNAIALSKMGVPVATNLTYSVARWLSTEQEITGKIEPTDVEELANYIITKGLEIC